MGRAWQLETRTRQLEPQPIVTPSLDDICVAKTKAMDFQ